MKATEARKIAEAANTGTIEEMLKEVYEAVKEAAEKGEYTAYVYFRLKPDAQAELERNGYTVTDVNDPRETCVQISWK